MGPKLAYEGLGLLLPKIEFGPAHTWVGPVNIACQLLETDAPLTLRR